MSSPFTYADIILNTLAVIFVADIDELVFSVCSHEMVLDGWDHDVTVDLWWKPHPRFEGQNNGKIFARNPKTVANLYAVEFYLLMPLMVMVSALLPLTM